GVGRGAWRAKAAGCRPRRPPPSPPIQARTRPSPYAAGTRAARSTVRPPRRSPAIANSSSACLRLLLEAEKDRPVVGLEDRMLLDRLDRDYARQCREDGRV